LTQSIAAQFTLAYQALTESDHEALKVANEEFNQTVETEEEYVKEFLL
jgi:hypothetical protein